MSVRLFIALLFVVALMVVGQLLFKATAVAWQTHGNWSAPTVLLWLFASLAVYAVATIAWVSVLQHVPLGRAYPFMALAFVFVPLMSIWAFGETQGSRYYLGVVLICIGVAVSASSPVTDRVTDTGLSGNRLS